MQLVDPTSAKFVGILYSSMAFDSVILYWDDEMKEELRGFNMLQIEA